MRTLLSLALLLGAADDAQEIPALLLKIDEADAEVRRDAFERLHAIPEARARLAKAVAAEGAVWLRKAAAERSRALKTLFAASRRTFKPLEVEAARKELIELLAKSDTKTMQPKVEALWKTIYVDPQAVALDEKFAAANARLSDVIGWQARLETPEKDSVGKRASEIFLSLDEATLLQAVPPKDQKIMAQNAALRAQVPEAEFRHALRVNRYRMLLGKGALRLDPKLCNASREHCADMIEHKFFAHESPLPGKRTPSDRARKHGASAGGENIYVGSDKPDDAFWAWFHSIGHHRNMAGDYAVFGVGNQARHWTQMFG